MTHFIPTLFSPVIGAAFLCAALVLLMTCCCEKPPSKNAEITAASAIAPIETDKPLRPEMGGFKTGMQFKKCMGVAKFHGFEVHENIGMSGAWGNGRLFGRQTHVNWKFVGSLPYALLTEMEIDFVEYKEASALAKTALFLQFEKMLGKPSVAPDNPDDDAKKDHENALWEFAESKVTLRKEISWPKGHPSPVTKYDLILRHSGPMPTLPEPPRDESVVKAATEQMLQAIQHLTEIGKDTSRSLEPDPGKCLNQLLDRDPGSVGPVAQCILKAVSVAQADPCLDACRK